jgi:hypothetical protein
MLVRLFHKTHPQDLTTVILPRLQVSATSKHYNALYNVVTDLLIYQDPGHRERVERIDSFTFAFDRKDRDPHSLLLELDSLQRIPRLAHADGLKDRKELFSGLEQIRSNLKKLVLPFFGQEIDVCLVTLLDAHQYSDRPLQRVELEQQAVRCSRPLNSSLRSLRPSA